MTQSSPVGVQDISMIQGPYGIPGGDRGKPEMRHKTLESFLPTREAIRLVRW
jgi:hypothetical protein